MSYEDIESTICYPDGALVKATDVEATKEAVVDALEQHRAHLPFRVGADGELDKQ